jgi:thioredoxin 1
MSHNVIQADDSDFEQQVVQAEGPVLVDFSATWCGPCKKLEPVVEEIAGDYAGRLKVVKVDVDRAPNSAARYAVMSVPTLLLFVKGQVREQVVGLVPKRAIAERVDRVV